MSGSVNKDGRGGRYLNYPIEIEVANSRRLKLRVVLACRLANVDGSKIEAHNLVDCRWRFIGFLGTARRPSCPSGFRHNWICCQATGRKILSL